MPESTSVRQLVVEADRELFSEHDTRVLRRSFAADFVEHSPLVADGLAGLGTLVEEAGPSLRHDVARVLVDGDLVALHGAYPGLADDVLIGFDIYRVAGGGRSPSTGTDWSRRPHPTPPDAPSWTAGRSRIPRWTRSPAAASPSSSSR